MAPSFGHSTTASELVAYYSDKIAGKNILVTGVTPGSLGSSFVQQVVAGKPSILVLTGRDPSKFHSVVDDVKASHPEIKVKSLTMNLSSLASVRAAAETFNNDAEVPYLDVLVLNAGIMGVPFSLTEDGFESQFQVNHLSHFLFSNPIMGKVLASPSPRVVVVSSNGHVIGGIRWSDWNFSGGKHYDPWLAYAQSKTANNLMAVALAERLGATKGLQAFSMHPGVIMSTGLGARAAASMGGADLMEAVEAAFARTGSKYMFEAETPKSLDQGTATHVVAAFDTDLATPENNGAHLINSHLADPYAQEVFSHSVSKIDADRLWKLSEKLVGQEFPY